jgi:heme/copper-type cytochrome/quinol oxidase subunit 2
MLSECRGSHRRSARTTRYFKSEAHTPGVKGWAKSTLVLLLILLASTVFFALIYRPPDLEAVPDVPLVSFELRLSLSGIEPAVIQVSQGSLVALNVTSMDESHHFGLTAFGISRWVPANETAEIRFHAALAGTFTYRCLITAPDHIEEEGSLRVVARS